MYDVGGDIYSTIKDARSQRLHSFKPARRVEGQPAILKRTAATYIAVGVPLERIMEDEEEEEVEERDGPNTLERFEQRGGEY